MRNDRSAVVGRKRLTNLYSGFTIHHSPRTTRHSPRTTRHSPLTIRHSPLTTRQRLLLILTLAYLLLFGIGPMATKQNPPGTWCGSNRLGACELFCIRQKMVGQMGLTALQAVAALLQALLGEAEN